LTIDERENFVTPEVGHCACALHKSISAVNGMDSAPFISEPIFQIWWRSVKIEAARGYRLHWIRCDQSEKFLGGNAP